MLTAGVMCGAGYLHICRATYPGRHRVPRRVVRDPAGVMSTGVCCVAVGVSTVPVARLPGAPARWCGDSTAGGDPALGGMPGRGCLWVSMERQCRGASPLVSQPDAGRRLTPLAWRPAHMPGYVGLMRPREGSDSMLAVGRSCRLGNPHVCRVTLIGRHRLSGWVAAGPVRVGRWVLSRWLSSLGRCVSRSSA